MAASLLKNDERRPYGRSLGSAIAAGVLWLISQVAGRDIGVHSSPPNPGEVARRPRQDFRYGSICALATSLAGFRFRMDCVAKLFCRLYRATLIRRRVPQRNFDSLHPRF
jgi:hypothetical protein